MPPVTYPISWPLLFLCGQSSQKASDSPIPENTPFQEVRIDPVLLYLTIKNSSESNGDGRISNTNVGQRKFTLIRSGVLAPFRSHPVGGPYHRPPRG